MDCLRPTLSHDINEQSENNNGRILLNLELGTIEPLYVVSKHLAFNPDQGGDAFPGDLARSQLLDKFIAQLAKEVN